MQPAGCLAGSVSVWWSTVDSEALAQGRRGLLSSRSGVVERFLQVVGCRALDLGEALLATSRSSRLASSWTSEPTRCLLGVGRRVASQVDDVQRSQCDRNHCGRTPQDSATSEPRDCRSSCPSWSQGYNSRRLGRCVEDRGVWKAVEQLELVAARLAVGEQASEELPDIAAEALVRGLDSLALRLAAGVLRQDVRSAREAFHDALFELGVELPEEQAALWTLTRETMARIVSGAVDPYDGASWIWSSVYWRFEREGDLRIFVGLASEWEDHAGSRPAIEIAIREAARHLLKQGQPRRWVKLQARVGEPPLRKPRSGRANSGYELGLTEQLQGELSAWATAFDSTQANPGIGPSGFDTARSAERFVEQGARLAKALQRELGDG